MNRDEITRPVRAWVIMKRIFFLLPILFFAASAGNAFAYYNVTFLNTTVILNSTNTNAKVIETISLFVSNASLSQYETSRAAYNLSLNDWQNIIHSTLPTEHILGPYGSVTDFALLPSAVVIQSSSGGYAYLIYSYTVDNATNVNEVAPRKFRYVLNDSIFNFEHTASGQQLPLGSRLNIVLPSGSVVDSVYPLPDYPSPNLLGSYSNQSLLSWYAQEPLNKFSFSYTITQSLKDEVLSYFGGIYDSYRPLVYIIIILLIGIVVAYIYLKFVAQQ